MVWNHPWTPEEMAHIRAHYGSIRNSSMAELLAGRTETAIRQQASRMGVKKSQERLAELARENFASRKPKGPFQAKPPQIEA